MIGSVKTFSIRGGSFEDTTSLELFKEPFNILFGRNGSGKTTITRGIKAYKDSEASTFETSFDVSIPEEERKHIHVLNEDFIHDKIQLGDDVEGLGTTVMLGEMVDIQSQIESKRRELTIISQAFNTLNTLRVEYEDERNDKSPNKKFKVLKDKLSVSTQLLPRYLDFKELRMTP